jgi:hypothetical protein
MIRRVLRILGALLLLAGLVLLADELLATARGGGFQPAALGGLWSALNPGSLELLQATTQRYVSVALWDGGVVRLLQLPACFVAIVLGAVLLLSTPRRRRSYGFR